MSKPFRLNPWVRALARAWPFLALPPAAFGNPTGGQVVAGSVTISAPDALTVQIDQSSAAAVVNWNSFSVGANERVQFLQPDGSAAILNRVIGGTPSDILGQIQANGRVFLINPQGVIFGAGSRIDVGSLVASTLDIADQDFLAGNYVFAGQGSAAAVRNAGQIRVAEGGVVVLAGERVEMPGLIEGRFAEVLLASGSALTLSLDGGPVEYSIDAPAVAQLAGLDVAGQILAGGGRVLLAARAAQDLAQVAVNLSGRVQANRLDELDGEIVLSASGGSVGLAGEMSGALVTIEADGDIANAGADAFAADTAFFELDAGGNVDLHGSTIAAANTVTLGAGSELRIAGVIQAGSDVAGSAGGAIGLGSVEAGLNMALAANGGDLDVGAVRGEQVNLSASGRVTTGDLTAVNDDGSAALVVFGGAGVRVEGSVLVRGTVGAFASSSSEGISAARAFIGASTDGVSIDGALTVEGTLGDVSVLGAAFVGGADVTLLALGGDIEVDGAIDVTGVVGNVQGGGFGMFADGADLAVEASFGSVRFGDTVRISGTIGDVSAPADLGVAGADLRITAGFGVLDAAADIEVAGDVGTVTGGSFVSVDAALSRLESTRGSILLHGRFASDGHVDALIADRGIYAAGTTVVMLPDQDLRIDGLVELSGRVDTFVGADDSGVIGANFFSLPFFGSAAFDGGLTIDGSVGSMQAGSSFFALGALATVVAYGRGFGDGESGISFGAPVTVTGTLGTVQAQDFVDLSGATLWLDAIHGPVTLDGPVTIDGRVGAIEAGRTLSVNGSLMLAASAIGTVTAGAIDSYGEVTSIDAVAEVEASGSDVLLQADIPTTEDGASLRLLGDIHQRGVVGTFTVLDPDATAPFTGGVLANAGAGGITFGDIEADSIFLSFDSNSSIGSASLVAREYLEIFTVSAGPTLSGDSLTMQSGGGLFIGANLDLGTLDVQAADSLTVYLATLRAQRLSLAAGGDLALIGFDPQFGPEPPETLRAELIGEQVLLSGRSVYGDERATIDAGGLDVRAQDTILLEGAVRVGSGNAGFAGDTALVQRLAAQAADLAPTGPGPNAYFSAPTVALAQLELAGDWLHIESQFTSLGHVQLQQPALVHLDPLVDLPFFAEAVDVDEAGLTSVQDRIRTDDNTVVPNFGSFDDFRGEQNVLGDRPRLGSDTALSGSTLDFSLDADPLNFGQLLLQSGLGGSTVVIGASDFDAGIQLSDRFDLDVLPSATNFVLLTSRGILGFDRIRTNGRVILLGGTPIDSRDLFYDMVRQEIVAYALATDGGVGPEELVLAADAEGEDDALQCR